MIKITDRRTVSALVLFIGLLLCSNPAMAMPSLQLDIENGIYDNGTTYSQGGVFELYALLLPKTAGVNRIGHNYIISASITPRQGEVINPNFGSITFGSELLDKNTMHYGTPPKSDPGAIPSHRIFPTYYWEYAFTFDKDVYSKAYNVSKVIGTHTGPEAWVEGQTRKMFYMAFDIDASNLNAGYAVHFDLYHVDSDNCFVDKAPFSHDAESSKKVPEPSTLILLGFGLMGVSLFGRKKR
jgi:hypothetical protein